MTALAYIVRPGESNEELRYSLRTVVANWPSVDQIVIVGSAPTWITGIEVVHGNRFKEKQRNVYGNMRILAEVESLPPDVVVMNDDFFILDTVDEMPMFRRRGTLASHIRSLGASSTWWKQSLRATELWLHHKGVAEPLSYELHRPFPIHREWMARVLKEAAQHQPRNPPQWRTLYGNRWQADAIPASDGKVYSNALDAPFPEGQPYLSTTDRSWERSGIGETIRERFPDPSPFEKVRPLRW